MTRTRTAPRRQALSRYRLVALWLPLAVMVVVAATQTIAIPDLTARVAIHFDWDGTADGWGPAWTYPVMTLGVGGGCTALFAGVGLLGFKGVGTSSGRPMRLRSMAAIASGAAAFLAMALGAGAVRSINGPNLLWFLLVAAVVAVGVGALGYRTSFDVEGEGVEPAQPPAVELESGERAVWTGRCTMGRAGFWIHIGAVVLCLLCLVSAAWAEIFATGNLGWVTWVTLTVVVLVGVAVPATTSVRVRVDASGLSVASPVGLPRVRIPLERISKAEVTEVNPMGEFGGWGWRLSLGGGGWAVCLRSGEGIRITRTNGKPFTVTVDDAATAVALLEGLRARG